MRVRKSRACGGSMTVMRAVGVLAAVLVLFVAGAVNAQERRPDRGFRAGNSYTISDLENVNMTNGNLMLSIPLASLPAGRGTSPGYTVSLQYNSKVWNAKREYRADGTGEGLPGLHYFRELMEQSQQGGWHLDAGGYRLDLVNRYEEMEPEIPCILASGEEGYQRNGYRFRLEMQLPNGSVTGFRPKGNIQGFYQDQYNDGFFRVDPWGVVHSYTYAPPSGESQIPACDSTHVLIENEGIHYYTEDGSRTRLFVPYQPGIPVSEMRWTLYLPDGRMIENLPQDDESVSQRLTDANGNKLVWKEATLNEINGFKIENEVGHFIFVGPDRIVQPGFDGELIETLIDWKSVHVYRKHWATEEQNAPTAYLYQELYDSLSVVDKITLPEQAGGLEYSFTYNGVDEAPDPEEYTDGWGELRSITLPSGARADYSYALDGVGTVELRNFDVTENHVVERVLTYDAEYDGGAQEVTETTEYSSGSGTGSACSPDGRCQTQYSAVGGDLNGYAYRIVHTGGSMVEKQWVSRRAMGGGVYMRIDPFVKTEYTTVADAGGDPAMTAIKDFEYDQNGNVLEIREYDWVPFSSVPRSDTGGVNETLPAPRVTGLPSSGLTLKRRTINTYLNATPNTLDAVQNHADHHSDPSAPKFLHLIRSTEVRDGSDNVVARTEFYYDDPDTGNLEETRVWDSTMGAVSDPLTGGNSVKTLAEYDQYGNVVETTDGNGNVTTIIYGDVTCPSGTVTGLYPTQTIVADGTAVERTSSAVYDCHTGLVTTATDEDNDVSVVTEYDDLGRPVKVRTAAGTGLESWVQTEYHDEDRYVVVKADLETVGDGKKVAIQHFDQLGRVRLSRTLEDASTQSASNEQHGIKVQTRYATTYSSPNGYTYSLTSNPYRAATSSAASTEPTMGWTRSKAHHLGRHSEVETFSGATLPAPWGANSSSTGMVQTDIDANATTVTDQAGKLRRSITNGLGQLVRVDEPNGSNQLGSVSSPNQATSYAYDTLNNLTTVTQGAQTRTFTYSSLSRLLSATNPESGTISYQYDSNGNLTGKIDARSITTTYTYDALNRVNARDYSDSTPDVDYTYGTSAPKVGKLVKVESSVSTTEYTGFDILGRVTAHKQKTDGNQYTTGYTYSLSGALLEQTYPSGRVVKNTLDVDGTLNQVHSKKSGETFRNFANGFNYNAAGAVTSMRLGNGLWETTQFNSRLQPTQIGLGQGSATQNRLKLDYSYGDWDGGSVDAAKNNGNIVKQVITVPTVGVSTGFAATQKYYYDSLNRLDDAIEEISSTQTWRQDFSYDRYGNRNFVEANTTTILKSCGSSPNFEVCTADIPKVNPVPIATSNKLTGYTYDSSGNTTEDANEWTYIYDAENKQVEVKDDQNATIGEYWYDGDGKRVKKYVPDSGETTLFVYDAAGKQIAEYSTIVQTGSNAKTAYLTADHLGSPRINTDGIGSVIARHDYHPFGEETATSARVAGLGYTSDTIRKQFTGYERDGETNLDYAKARMFGSGLGRFTSPDYFANDTHTSDAQSWNLYVYVRNNPLRYADPSGKLKKNADGTLVKDPRNQKEENDLEIGGKTYAFFGKDVNIKGKTYRIVGEVKKVWVYGDNGKKIKATQGVGSLQLIETSKIQSITQTVGFGDSEQEVNTGRFKASEQDLVSISEAGTAAENLSHSCNCHGTTFGNNEVWINNDQIKNLLEYDSYSQTDTPQVGDVGIFGDYSKKNELKRVEHSVRVSGVEDGKVTEVYGKGGIEPPKSTSPSNAWNEGVQVRYWTKKNK